MTRAQRVALPVAILLSGVLLPTAASSAAGPPSHTIETAFTVPVPDQIASFSCGHIVCHGTAVGGATYTGGWSGSSAYSYGFTYLPTGGLVVAITEQVTGTVETCGAGTFTVLSRETILASGTAHGEWSIIAGTGDLLGLTGRGTSTAQYQADGVGAGVATGWVKCPI